MSKLYYEFDYLVFPFNLEVKVLKVTFQHYFLFTLATITI